MLSILEFGIFVSWKATFLKIVPSAGSTEAAWKSKELSPLLVLITKKRNKVKSEVKTTCCSVNSLSNGSIKM